MDVDIEWITRELRNAVQRLASDGPDALSKHPDGVVKADELALDFDNHLNAYLGNCREHVTDTQRRALLAVDALLTAMSGANQSELWTEQAVCHHPRWTEVRAAARKALVAFAWY